MASKKVARLLPNEVVFFECDIQEKFTMIHKVDAVHKNAVRLCKTAALFNIPVISTIQNPRVFG